LCEEPRIRRGKDVDVKKHNSGREGITKKKESGQVWIAKKKSGIVWMFRRIRVEWRCGWPRKEERKRKSIRKPRIGSIQ
jgi:frataxin-like iron-binding protein CyaY